MLLHIYANRKAHIYRPVNITPGDEEDDDLDEDTCPLSQPHDGNHQAKLEADIVTCQRRIGVKSCTDCVAWPFPSGVAK